MADNPFEIPQALRDASEQNMKQAHAAYEQLTDFVTKAMGAWMGAMPSNPMAAVVKDVQDRAVEIAKKNAELSFRAGRKDHQGTEFSRDFDASDAVRSRPDEGVHHANAGALQADRRNCPEAPTQLIYNKSRARGKGAAQVGCCSWPMKEQHRRSKREPNLFHPNSCQTYLFRPRHTQALPLIA